MIAHPPAVLTLENVNLQRYPLPTAIFVSMLMQEEEKENTNISWAGMIKAAWYGVPDGRKKAELKQARGGMLLAGDGVKQDTSNLAW